MRASGETLAFLVILANEAPYAGDNASLLALHAKLARERRGPPLVYIAGPFTADNQAGVEVNIAEATLAGMRVDGWEASKGATGERREAERIGMPVFDDAGSDFCEWLTEWKA